MTPTPASEQHEADEHGEPPVAARRARHGRARPAPHPARRPARDGSAARLVSLRQVRRVIARPPAPAPTPRRGGCGAAAARRAAPCTRPTIVSRSSSGASFHARAVTATRRADAVTEADRTSSDARTRVPTRRASTRGDVVTVMSADGASRRRSARRAARATITISSPATPTPIAMPRTRLLVPRQARERGPPLGPRDEQAPFVLRQHPRRHHLDHDEDARRREHDAQQRREDAQQGSHGRAYRSRRGAGALAPRRPVTVTASVRIRWPASRYEVVGDGGAHGVDHARAPPPGTAGSAPAGRRRARARPCPP